MGLASCMGLACQERRQVRGEVAGVWSTSSVAAHEVCVCGVDEGLKLHLPHVVTSRVWVSFAGGCGLVGGVDGEEEEEGLGRVEEEEEEGG